MEELILRYYLSLFSLIITLYFLYFSFIKNFIFNDFLLNINKGESISKISLKLSSDLNLVEKFLLKQSLILKNYQKPINYGKFNIKKDLNLLQILDILTNKSNLDYKITIIEGWQEYNFKKYVNEFYTNSVFVDYNKILADTYYINSSNNFIKFVKFAKKDLNKFFIQHKDNEILKKYGQENILIISSLVEKEAKNNSDKKLISSVIFNRLKNNMKLQIDASVIFSITNGKFKLKDALTYSDLKIKHPYSTYHINGLPPGMICYVGKETIISVLDNIKTDYLFYFYNILKEKHIFSKNFKEHKFKLNEYRKQKK